MSSTKHKANERVLRIPAKAVKVRKTLVRPGSLITTDRERMPKHRPDYLAECVD